MQTTLAARYARAMADVVGDKTALEAAAAELELLSRVLAQSKPLRDFLLNPAFPVSRKVEALGAVGKKCKVSAITGRLLEILLRKGRIDLLPEVAAEFRRIEEIALNRVAVEVTTAIPLEPAQQKRMLASLEKFTGKSVRLETRVDPEVLGGARARIGSVVFDGTVAGRMAKLKQQLIGER